MADINAVIRTVLLQEDSTLSGVITNIPGDNGGTTRFGITLAAAPDLAEQGFFTDAIPADRAFVMAQSWYAAKYAAPLYLDQISSQGIATALMSYAVNQEAPGGSGRAVRELQQAAANLGAAIVVDGSMGQKTVAAVNSLAAGALLEAQNDLELAFYRAIIVAHPDQAKFLKGWISRVDQNRSVQA